MRNNVKQIPLTQNQFALVDNEDFEYLNQFKWCAAFDKCVNSYYAYRHSPSVNREGRGTKISMHRVIMCVTDPKNEIDHIDHNTLNNCKFNLRIATHSQNSANRKPKKNGTSKYLGVCRQNNKWQAHIRKDNKLIRIGYFVNEIDAALAYNEKAIELHRTFANLNLIPALYE